MAATINGEFRGAFARRSALTWLLAVNIAVSVALRAVAAACVVADADEALVPTLIEQLSLRPSSAFLFPWLWRWITYMFVQYSPSHILFNMMWLAWFGMFMQQWCGNRHLLGAYAAGGIAGGLSFLAWARWAADFAGTNGLVGASASVIAVAVAVTVIFPDRPVDLLFLGKARLKWVSAAMLVICLLWFSGYNAGSDAAHAGGALAGLTYGFAYRFAMARMAKPKPLQTVVSSATSIPAANSPSSQLTDMEQLDSLLDKIRRSGYSSLSPSERETLFNLSQRINK